MKVMSMETNRQKQAGSEGPESQFVTFEIGAHTFLIPIERVVEFRTWTEPTSVPHTPDYVRGIVNIRGEIVPEPGARHVVVIVRGEDSRSVGLLVDSVTDIVNARPDNMAPMPRIEGGDATPFMSGVVFAEERILGVTDVDRLVTEAFPDGGESAGPPT
jgi:purine-binding chemotaxis protein CheW